MKHDTITTTSIDPTVLYAIARLTTLGTTGVSSLAPISFGANKTAKENHGVKIIVDQDKLYIDLYIITKLKENVRLVADTVQKNVKRAMHDMVDMHVEEVNVHIADVDLEIK